LLTPARRAIAVQIAHAGDYGIALEVPHGIAPPGGRRAGLTAHWFSRGVVGQRQRIHTGWMQTPTSDDRVTYAPHTSATYRMPPSHLIYRTAVGLFTRLRYRQARRACVTESGVRAI
jgi:hypothetical protein